MSRRDTIIIAVLINAGLLIVLFASALKSKDPESALASTTPPNVTNLSELPLQKTGSAAPADEVDQALNQFARTGQAAPAGASSSQAVAAALPTSQAPAPNFADDLKAITMPDTGASFTSAATQIAEPAHNLAMAPERTESVAANETEIKVKKGDVLDKIARTHHTSVEEIMKLNGLSSTRLKIGQPLRIPAKAPKAVAAQPKKAPSQGPSHAKAVAAEAGKIAAEGAAKFYVVKNGDNPWTIAVKNHMKVEELLKLNNLNAEKARHLKPGDQIRIR
jgi:FOG: LysM repeat